MELKLKVGDSVYDQLLFPDQRGEVVEIQNYLLVIKFGDDERYYPYKIDDQIGNHFPPQLSTTPYQIIGITRICS